jgi:murein peptide amidase A
LILTLRPRLVLSVHQPLALVDYDGPAESAAAQLSQRIGLPLRRLGARPGSMGSFVGEDLGIPIITLELPGAASKSEPEALWSRYGQALLEWIESM